MVNDAAFWKTQWLSHGSDRSAGVAILKNNFDGEVLHSESDPNGRYILLIVNIDNNILMLANIYGYNTRHENDLFLDVLESRFLYLFSKYPNLLLLRGGDFNIALNGSLDRWPPNSMNPSSSNLLLFMQKFSLIGIWRGKNPNVKLYTWNNKHFNVTY